MDKIFESWLERQHAEALQLCVASHVLRIVPEPGPQPARRYLAHFNAPTMVRAGTEVIRADGFAALFHFPFDYLRRASDAAQIVSLLAPEGAFHPNVRPPFICIGHFAPGTSLCELLYQVYEVMTYQKVTVPEHDALNPEASAWARRHMHLFPLSTAPLRRRSVAFRLEEIGFPGAPHASA